MCLLPAHLFSADEIHRVGEVSIINHQAQDFFLISITSILKVVQHFLWDVPVLFCMNDTFKDFLIN